MDWKKVGVIAVLAAAAALYVAAAIPSMGYGMGYGYGMPMMGYGMGMGTGMGIGYGGEMYGMYGYNQVNETFQQQPQIGYVPYWYYGYGHCPMMGYW